MATVRPLQLLAVACGDANGPLKWQSQRYRHRLRAQQRIKDLEDAGTQDKLDAALSKIKDLEDAGTQDKLDTALSKIKDLEVAGTQEKLKLAPRGFNPFVPQLSNFFEKKNKMPRRQSKCGW